MAALTDNGDTMMTLRIQLLGGFSITANDKELLPQRHTTRMALLTAFLLLRRDRRQSRQQVAYLFWIDSTEEQARGNLRRLLHALREQAPELATHLQMDDAYLRWRSDPAQEIDVAAFESALRQAALLEQSDDPALANCLAEAVSLYTGELLPGRYEDWVLAERQRLQSAYLNALKWLVDLLEQSGRMREAIRYAELLLQADRLRETSHLLLMRLHAAAGDRARALAAYAGCARLLRDELGVEPGPAIQELHRRLLQEPEPVKLAPARTPPVAALVGRAPQWEQLLDRWRRAADGSAQAVVVTGEAGIGKTRLAEELIRHCRALGVVALNASCPPAQEPVPYGTLANWLAARPLAHRFARLDEDDVAHLQLISPALRKRYPALRPVAGATPWQQLRLHQALAALLVDPEEPTLLCLDDAQWCDEQSLAWLQHLFAAEPDARLLVVFGVRTGEFEGQPIARTCADLLAKDNARTIDLTRLSAAESIQLAQHSAAHPLDDATLARVFALSAGIPLFIIEWVRMVEAAHAAPVTAALPQSALLESVPAAVSATILRRRAFLSPPARQLLDIAAVIGTRFALTLLRQVDRLSDDARIHALDELQHRALILRERGDRYAFSPELVREVIYQQIGDGRRHHLHRQIAEAMTSLYAADLTSVSQQIAEHLARAESPGD